MPWVILGQDLFLSPLSGSGIGISRSLSLPCDLTGGGVGEWADGGSWQYDKQETALVSLLLQTGCGRVNCWHGMPGELKGLARAQEVVVVEEEMEEEGQQEEKKGQAEI